MDYTDDNEVRFTMRMNAQLYEQLKQSAKENRRSIAKELENMADIYLNKDCVVTFPQDIGEKIIKMLEKYEP